MEKINKYSLIYGKMEELNISQKQLADMLSMPQATLSKKLTGEKAFNMREVYATCYVLGINKNDIVPCFFS